MTTSEQDDVRTALLDLSETLTPGPGQHALYRARTAAAGRARRARAALSAAALSTFAVSGAVLVTHAVPGTPTESLTTRPAAAPTASVSGDRTRAHDSCAPTAAQAEALIDYADVLHVRGRQYIAAGYVRLPRTLGPQVGVITCRLSGSRTPPPGYTLRDGDATDLPVGTAVRARPGWDPDEQVAAVIGQGPGSVLYVRQQER